MALLVMLPAPALASLGIHHGPTRRFLSGQTVKRGPGTSDWPNNVFLATNHYVDANCTAKDVAFGTDRVDGCTGPGTAVPTLNGFDGADIQWALTQCQAASGCTLALGCHTYTEAENTIYSAAPPLDQNRNGVAYSAGFQNGLLILGELPSTSCPTGTVLKSSLKSGWDNTVFATQGIFSFRQWDPPGTPTRGITRIGFRNFECNGQSDFQSSMTVNATAAWTATTQYHACVHARTGESAPYTYVEVDHLNAHHFMGSGFAGGDMEQSFIHGNTINRIGCWQDFSNAVCNVADNDPFPCCNNPAADTCSTLWANGIAVVGDSACGCGAGDPGQCRGWNQEVELGGGAVTPVGIKTTGFGIEIQGTGVNLIQDNSISRATKYGSTCGIFAPGTASATDTCKFIGNTYTLNASGGFAGTHFQNVTYQNNLVVSNGMQGGEAVGDRALGSNGAGMSLQFLSNTIQQSFGSGIQVWSWIDHDSATVPTLTIASNSIAGTAVWAQIQGNMAGTVGPLVVDPHMTEPCPLDTNKERHNTNLMVSGNVTANDNAGSGALSISQGAATCPGYFMNPAVITGGSMFPSTVAAQTILARLKSVQNLTATGITLKRTVGHCAGGTPCLFTFLLNTTGSCSGFILEADTAVDDQSAGAVTGAATNCP